MHNLALESIRKNTISLHHQLDKKSPLTKLMTKSCTVEDYQSAMYGLALAYLDIDKVFIKAARHCPASLPPYQARLPVLNQDIKNLGMKLPDPATCSLSPPSGNAGYLGMRYVIEGASLGAKVIRRKLSSSDIAGDIRAASGFWSEKQTRQNCWPALLQELAGLVSRPAIDEASKAASDTFTYFIHCLNIKGHDRCQP